MLLITFNRVVDQTEQVIFVMSRLSTTEKYEPRRNSWRVATLCTEPGKKLQAARLLFTSFIWLHNYPTKCFNVGTENRAPAFKATSSGILKSFLINIDPVENLNLIGLCQILSCVFFFFPCFAFQGFQDSQLSRLSLVLFKKYMAKPSFKRMFLGDYFIDYILTRQSVFPSLFD